MSIKKRLLSAFRAMNFAAAEAGWQVFVSGCDFKVVEDLPETDILIISPHPDDEIFACSGVISGVNKKRKIKITYIFSGDKQSQSERSKVREEESKSAVEQSANLEQIFFRQPDNSIITKQTIADLSAVVLEMKPGIILMPSFSCPNDDHREATRAVAEALKLAKIKGFDLGKISIWLYGVWGPLPYFNRLLKVNMAEKEKSMEKFFSQHKDRNYIKAIKSLDDYYGEVYGLAYPAEAFFAGPADLLLKLYKK
ncbi:MAG: PIG-L family deacetylase [Candidatus Berkelbacteria bacterium]|nr:PIG-L family deacetylase [Candidatus Berkelbacteria bacterium]